MATLLEEQEYDPNNPFNLPEEQEPLILVEQSKAPEWAEPNGRSARRVNVAPADLEYTGLVKGLKTVADSGVFDKSSYGIKEEYGNPFDTPANAALASALKEIPTRADIWLSDLLGGEKYARARGAGIIESDAEKRALVDKILAEKYVTSPEPATDAELFAHSLTPGGMAMRALEGLYQTPAEKEAALKAAITPAPYSDVIGVRPGAQTSAPPDPLDALMADYGEIKRGDMGVLYRLDEKGNRVNLTKDEAAEFKSRAEKLGITETGLKLAVNRRRELEGIGISTKGMKPEQITEAWRGMKDKRNELGVMDRGKFDERVKELIGAVGPNGQRLSPEFAMDRAVREIKRQSVTDRYSKYSWYKDGIEEEMAASRYNPGTKMTRAQRQLNQFIQAEAAGMDVSKYVDEKGNINAGKMYVEYTTEMAERTLDKAGLTVEDAEIRKTINKNSLKESNLSLQEAARKNAGDILIRSAMAAFQGKDGQGGAELFSQLSSLRSAYEAVEKKTDKDSRVKADEMQKSIGAIRDKIAGLPVMKDGSGREIDPKRVLAELDYLYQTK